MCSSSNDLNVKTKALVNVTLGSQSKTCLAGSLLTGNFAGEGSLPSACVADAVCKVTTQQAKLHLTPHALFAQEHKIKA